MEISIKPLTLEYDAFMWDLLYRNIFKGKTDMDSTRDIEDLPELRYYVENFGARDGDFGFVALNSKNQPVGAVWIRFFDNDYHSWGYIDEFTPEMNIALEAEYRGNGIGTKLMDKIFEHLPTGIEQISISIHPKNRCVGLYERYGFEKTEDRPPAIVMIKKCKENHV